MTVQAIGKNMLRTQIGGQIKTEGGMTHITHQFPDPRDGKTVHCRFRLQSGVSVTRSCVYRAHEFSSPTSQIMAEDPLFRRPVKFLSIDEVHPAVPMRVHRRFLPAAFVLFFGIN